MLQVRCPWCGDREQVEFSCHGEACVPRPENPDALDDRAWGEYLFFKENAKGLTWERWQHAFGCRRWFVALRDNVCDTFLGFAKPGDPLPSVPKGYRQAQSCASIPMPRSAKGYGAADKRTVKSSTSKSSAVKSSTSKSSAVKPSASKSSAVKSSAVKSSAVKSSAVKSSAVKPSA